MADCNPFIDCESISISGSADGVFSISFDYYSIDESVDGSSAISIVINNQTYTGYVLSHSIRRISNLAPSVSCVYWIHSFQYSTTSL